MYMRAGRYHRRALNRSFRPYFFELLVLVNLAVIALFAHASFFLLGDVVKTVIALLMGIGVQAVVGIGARAIIAVARGDRSYLRRVRRRLWIVDTLRLIAGSALMIFTYGWLKLVVPLFRASNFDAALFELDRVVGLGISPSIFLLDLFGGAGVLHIVDWCYANIFYASLFIAMAFFLSHPSRRIRIAFMNGNTALWMSGAWLYFLVPSLGPAYRFPDIWLAQSESLRITQNLQALLMRNWQTVLRSWEAGRIAGSISLAFGIAAFPSLHVAFQTYVFFWMRRLWTSGQVVFATFALTIFLGSMITGWHYLIDGLAGIAMAYLCYRLAIRRARRLFLHA
jgi:hypothetical protein